MSDHLIKTIASTPGIQRDGTRFDASSYIDGKWVRFYRGKPRKIGGYKLIIPGTDDIIRQIYVDSTTDIPNNGVVVYLGSPQKIITAEVDELGTASTSIDITPITEFTPNLTNSWCFDVVSLPIDAVPSNVLLALVYPDADNINSTSEGNLFYGIVGSTDALLPVLNSAEADAPLTGSCFVCSVGNIIVIGNAAGFIRYSSTGELFDWPVDNIFQVANTKLVACYETRGGGAQTAIIWSLNALTRISFVQSDLNWAADVISSDISILSRESVVQVNSVFYWLGIEQAYIFNGVVQTIDNVTNRNFLYDNLNYAARTKVFGVHLPKFNEIWWGVPLSGSSEVNHVFVYNYKENFWYDTPLNRSAAFYSSVFQYPFMASSILEPDLTFQPVTPFPPNVYSTYIHEFSFNAERYGQSYAIESYFTTNYFTLMDVVQDAAKGDRQVRTRVIEIDFNQSEDMTCDIINRGYPNSEPKTTGPYTFSSTTTKIDTAAQGRLVSYKFTSNTLNGFYQMGVIRVQFQIGDERPGS
jgi:hypothetical protein